ncbi:MAG: MBOAT family protein [Deltaproteobacteria bacterium]|nr:MBOAT family protein [Deltaproteobacteria bacterium]MBW2444575.1 MBOAT family protein [Deltaproteobacteria bacterium]
MLFFELRFFVFFALVFAVHWALRRNGPRKLWLLSASYFFYASWDWRFLGLILLSTAVDYIAAGRIAAETREPVRRRWLVISLALNLGILGFFKYFNFFVQSGIGVLQALGLPAEVRELAIVLPVGISFFTFQSMSYTIDVHRRRLEPAGGFVDFALFVSFFPQLVAGPIVRALGFLPQLRETRAFGAVAVRASLTLFLVGFIKKACIADHVAVAADAVFAGEAVFGAASHWLAAMLYSVQIFCDFSGYTDMALGLAGLLGYQLVPNFDFPYFARSIREFWRRWHISLSSWFRDYLYLPLGGNRHGRGRTLRNLMAVFLLCGLWHGASWTFVLWGLFHGGLMLLERTRFEQARAALPGAVQWLYAYGLVVCGWVIFRSQDVASMLGFFAGMLPGGGGGGGEALAGVWWFVLAGLALAHAASFRFDLPARFARLPHVPFAFLYGAAWALALQWVATGHRPFIYFQF